MGHTTPRVRTMCAYASMHAFVFVCLCAHAEADAIVVGYIVAVLHVVTSLLLAILGLVKLFRTYRGWHSSGNMVEKALVTAITSVRVSQNPMFDDNKLRPQAAETTPVSDNWVFNPCSL